MQKFTGLLNETAAGELDDLYRYFDDGAASLRDRRRTRRARRQGEHAPPLRRREGGDPRQVRAVQGEVRAVGKVRGGGELAELERLEKLPDAWTSPERPPRRRRRSTRPRRVSARNLSVWWPNSSSTRRNTAAFAAKSPKNVEDAAAHAPLDAAASFRQAESANAPLREREKDLVSGMEIFACRTLLLRELALVEREMEHLTKLWGLVAEWLGAYDGGRWAISGFEIESMESLWRRPPRRACETQQRQGGRSGVGHVGESQGVIAFKKTMPLISDLRNPAIGAPHWSQVMETCGRSLIRTATISPRKSHRARPAPSRRVHRGDVHQRHQGTRHRELPVVHQGDVGRTAGHDARQGGSRRLQARSTEDRALEDNTVTLSTMKASKFFVVFESTITSWEQKLMLVSEMVDLVLKVQTAWMYLRISSLGRGYPRNSSRRSHSCSTMSTARSSKR